MVCTEMHEWILKDKSGFTAIANVVAASHFTTRQWTFNDSINHSLPDERGSSDIGTCSFVTRHKRREKGEKGGTSDVAESSIESALATTEWKNERHRLHSECHLQYLSSLYRIQSPTWPRRSCRPLGSKSHPNVLGVSGQPWLTTRWTRRSTCHQTSLPHTGRVLTYYMWLKECEGFPLHHQIHCWNITSNHRELTEMNSPLWGQKFRSGPKFPQLSDPAELWAISC